jgi:hypothetical protein
MSTNIRRIKNRSEVLHNTYHGHSGNQTVKGATPSGGQKKFNSTNVVVGALGVDGSEGNGRCNDRNEHKERDGNSFGVEIGHFLAPMGTDGRLDIVHDPTTKSLRRRWSMVVVFFRRFLFAVSLYRCLVKEPRL